MISSSIFANSSLKLKQFQKLTFTICRRNTSSKAAIAEDINNVGILTLNRPMYNPLNPPMMQIMASALRKWERENKTCVIIKGAGGKAFCAGGDVKEIAAELKHNVENAQGGFLTVYQLYNILGTYKIPYVSLMNGFVVGGGVGIGVYGKYRVATETSHLSFPETQIGLYTEASASYFLPRLKNKIGIYLALTGESLTGSDLLESNLATHYTSSKHLPELEQGLTQCTNVTDIENTLKKFSIPPEKPFTLEPYIDKINFCFSATSMEGIYERLEKDNSKWSNKIIKILNRMSPTSLKLTLKIMNEGINLNLEDALRVEYRVTARRLVDHDFPEGVRALLIDKDGKPKWKPNTMQEVKDEVINKYFEKLPNNNELKYEL